MRIDDKPVGVVETLFDVDEGDKVLIETTSYAYASPFTIGEIDERRSNGATVRLITILPDNPASKRRTVRVVEGDDPPVFSHHRITDVTPTDGSDDAWCGWCGRGFPTEPLAKQHAAKVHDDTNAPILDVEPDLECDDCGRRFFRQGKYQSHRNSSRCGATLPDHMDEAGFRELVDEVDTLLELNREIRNANRSQILQLLEERSLEDEVATAETRSPGALIEAAGLGDDDRGWVEPHILWPLALAFGALLLTLGFVVGTGAMI